MDTMLGWTVIVLPTFLGIVAMWFTPPHKKHPQKWRAFLLLCGFIISSLTLWEVWRQDHASIELRQQRDASEITATRMEAMLKTADERQRSAQQKLDEAIQREQRLNDQNNDLQTELKKQDALLQIMKQWLPSRLQKKADSIPKQYKRELYDDLNLTDDVAAPKSAQRPN